MALKLKNMMAWLHIVKKTVSYAKQEQGKKFKKEKIQQWPAWCRKW